MNVPHPSYQPASGLGSTPPLPLPPPPIGWNQSSHRQQFNKEHPFTSQSSTNHGSNSDNPHSVVSLRCDVNTLKEHTINHTKQLESIQTDIIAKCHIMNKLRDYEVQKEMAMVTSANERLVAQLTETVESLTTTVVELKQQLAAANSRMTLNELRFISHCAVVNAVQATMDCHESHLMRLCGVDSCSEWGDKCQMALKYSVNLKAGKFISASQDEDNANNML